MDHWSMTTGRSKLSHIMFGFDASALWHTNQFSTRLCLWGTPEIFCSVLELAIGTPIQMTFIKSHESKVNNRTVSNRLFRSRVINRGILFHKIPLFIPTTIVSHIITIKSRVIIDIRDYIFNGCRCGLLVVLLWSNKCIQVVPTGHQVVPFGQELLTKWLPSGHWVVTKWSPSGHQVVTVVYKWTISGPLKVY